MEIYNTRTSNSTMSHQVVLLNTFLHLKCTSVESPTGITINCRFLGGKKNYEVPKENSNGIEMDECKAVLSGSKLWMRLI